VGATYLYGLLLLFLLLLMLDEAFEGAGVGGVCGPVMVLLVFVLVVV
jgi:hypothetical protein